MAEGAGVEPAQVLPRPALSTRAPYRSGSLPKSGPGGGSRTRPVQRLRLLPLPSWATPGCGTGGRIRTCSVYRVGAPSTAACSQPFCYPGVVRAGGVEPPEPSASGWWICRSPTLASSGAGDRSRTCPERVLEPPPLPRGLHRRKWSGWRDSNPRDPAPKAGGQPLTHILMVLTNGVEPLSPGFQPGAQTTCATSGLNSMLAGASAPPGLPRRVFSCADAATATALVAALAVLLSEPTPTITRSDVALQVRERHGFSVEERLTRRWRLLPRPRVFYRELANVHDFLAAAVTRVMTGELHVLEQQRLTQPVRGGSDCLAEKGFPLQVRRRLQVIGGGGPS